jgi:NADH dehydrogenase [ubiquinone] 1 alpha subcomplex assembly factor 7
MTPLEEIICAMIADDGPMPLDRYMGLCLGHPQHGYYMSRDPLGVLGDFTTAPEISQVFGELVGVWCVQAWQMIGAPWRFSLVELGPGRGTLMKDILRATRKVPGFSEAAKVQFVETSPVLRRAQADAVDKAEWHATITTLPGRPSIIVANEFFDALPVKQYEEKDGVVRERVVGLRDGTLALGLSEDTGLTSFGKDGVFEISPARLEAATALGQLISQHDGAALVIDYGHRKSSMGDTLQAVKGHAFCSILATPGEADLTSHVDFEQIAVGFRHGKALPHGATTQGTFLSAMGLSLRTDALARGLADGAKEDFLKGAKRLADDTEMGHLFKVMAVTRTGVPAPYPFEDS